MRGLLLVILLAGCWRNTGAEEPEATPTTAGASCDEVAAHSRDIIAASSDTSLVRRADQISHVIAERCAADVWSIELRRCIAGAKTLDDTDGCEQLQTPAQRTAFKHEIEMMENAD